MKPQVCATPGAALLRQQPGAGRAVPRAPAFIPRFLFLLPDAGALPDPRSTPESRSQSCPSLLQPRAVLCPGAGFQPGSGRDVLWVLRVRAQERELRPCSPARTADFSTDLDSLFFTGSSSLCPSWLVWFFIFPPYAVKPQLGAAR